MISTAPTPQALRAQLETTLADQLRTRLTELPRADRYADELSDWCAEVSRCHDNVDRWLIAHPGDRPERGWLLTSQMDTHFQLMAHSMVRNKDGDLLDVTLPRGDFQPRFIAHPSEIGGFFALLCSPQPCHVLTVCTDGAASTSFSLGNAL